VKKLLFAALLLVPALSMAEPTAEETMKVLDHYWNGSTPILVEYKFCADIAKEGDNKNECAGEVNPQSIAKDAQVYLWMNYMVPQNTSHDISILLNRNGRPEKTRNFTITGSLRYRTWTALPTGKDGEYTVQIDREVNDNYTTMKSLKYKVKE